MSHSKGLLRCYVPRPRARVRLYCFPHAGGSASVFRGWAELLPEWVELTAVQYPGRQDRYGDPLPASLPELAEEILDGIGADFDLTTAFLGHSMGAVVAFEAARLLRPRFPSPLAMLFASGSKAPAVRRPKGLTFEEDGIRGYLDALGGAGAQALTDPELWRIAYPVICGDLRLAETYHYRAGAPLACPLVAVGGDQDPAVTPEDIALWKDCTMSGADIHVLPGGHFYFEESLPELAALLTRKLNELTVRRR
ncbi:thioesterase II family protein [Streptomyces sp. NPDC054863]